MVGKIHWSITCFLSEMGSCLSWSISLFFPKQLHPALILAYISSLVVSLRCVVCPRYLNYIYIRKRYLDIHRTLDTYERT